MLAASIGTAAWTMGGGRCVASTEDSGARSKGFDFLLGSWSVRHRRLAERLVGSARWLEFPGTLVVSPILGGLGDIDDNDLHDPTGRYRATSLRLFDGETGEWAIRWIDGRRPGIDEPLVGRFTGRIGHFYSEDTFDGRPIRVRFTYEDVDAGQARWEQAFSVNKGVTWEPNWTMEFLRAG